jgi:hypothetical protein
LIRGEHEIRSLPLAVLTRDGRLSGTEVNALQVYT